MGRLVFGLLAALLVLGALSLFVGEVALSAEQWRAALTDPASGAADVVWRIRAPRALAASLVGAALGLAGAVMQGLLRNPLADPGVLGVSAMSGLGAALTISAGMAGVAGAVEGAALLGALVGAAVLAVAAYRVTETQTLILLGVAFTGLAGALTAVVFNLSPSPVATSEVLTWLQGSVANRDFGDSGRLAPVLLAGAGLCVFSGPALRMLSLGDEAAALSGLPMARMRVAAMIGTSLLVGAATALSGVVGFVGLAAPHWVRPSCGEDPARLLGPSALAGAIMVMTADLSARVIPTAEELHLGVLTALFGAPVFAVLVWRVARSWR